MPKLKGRKKLPVTISCLAYAEDAEKNSIRAIQCMEMRAPEYADRVHVNWHDCIRDARRYANLAYDAAMNCRELAYGRKVNQRTIAAGACEAYNEAAAMINCYPEFGGYVKEIPIMRDRRVYTRRV